MIAELHPIVEQFVDWRKIREFAGYSVSSTGMVRNDESGRQMSMMVNQSGVVHVGLTKNRVQYRRAVALLVVHNFLAVLLRGSFDTPINLNGDRFDNDVENLVLRPRWFATKYFQQFNNEPHTLYPIEDGDSGDQFDTVWSAATYYGVLQEDILKSVYTGRPVWPIDRVFRQVK